MIYNINEKKELVYDYFYWCDKTWGKEKDFEKRKEKIESKTKKYLSGNDDNIISILVLVIEDKLAGFISLFKEDGVAEYDLTPWYATMFVHPDFRGNGYSKLLNDAIKKEAHNLGFKRIYLKSKLVNYYEKFGAIYMTNLSDIEKMYYMDV